MKQRVTNHSLHPEMLDSGQQLAAAGTRGSVREDVQLSPGDIKRLRGKVSVVPVEEVAEASGGATAEPAAKSKQARKS
jgi:hypothetical protein